MLDSLNVKNYRNIKELRIGSLGRVNLLTGKNNTGKSTILEAIAIYAAKGDLGLIQELLIERGESVRQRWEHLRETETNRNYTETNIRELSSLFTDRVLSFGAENSISIGGLENTLSGEKIAPETLSLRFVRYFNEIQKASEGIIAARTRILLEDELNREFADLKTGIEIKFGNRSYLVSLDGNQLYKGRPSNLGDKENFQFIRTRNIDREINGRLWDQIALTEKEKYVIEALKIIEPATERIAFIEGSPRERTAVIKLANNPKTLPLRSMGDGINRILTIILALANSDNGFLLIDEFENGLHYTAQEQLWKIIFSLAEKLNVQVFATTHSEDCIKGFEYVLNSPENKLEGKLIRLDLVKGTIKQVEFNARELKIATDQNIETR